mmetsp:Transcript_25384/g.48605  ORF Transcript_25384/g.48605 Transcript_25384/m.48605 type:complete len:83 (+) Transcript_25384:1459-1707(+)
MHLAVPLTLFDATSDCSFRDSSSSSSSRWQSWFKKATKFRGFVAAPRQACEQGHGFKFESESSHEKEICQEAGCALVRLVLT